MYSRIALHLKLHTYSHEITLIYWHLMQTIPRPQKVNCRVFGRQDAQNEMTLSALHQTFCSVLAFDDGGYLLNISRLTTEATHPHAIFCNESTARAKADSLINAVFDRFTKNKEGERSIIIKKQLEQLGQINILENDQEFIHEISH